MPTFRQLAAIMFTDIVGYTTLMGSDGKKALTVLSHNRSLQKPIIEKYNGRWIKENGDGVIASFPAVSDAVHAAIHIQEQCNATHDYLLRVGIHLGEVVFENDDVFGDGVHIAARIQAAADPGSIFISGKVYDDIKNLKEIQTVSMGSYVLKNVKDPMDLFAISNPGVIVPVRLKTAIPATKSLKKCLLVLPFVNLSNDPENDYFSDGLTDELITNLSRLKDVRVISRTTSMLYKNSQKDIKQIGLETGASYVMEGSVRAQGPNIRITAQFIDAALDTHLWAETFRGKLDDIFDIQESVSGKIVQALRMRLTGDEMNTLRKRYTENTEAYRLYLKGRYFWSKRNQEALLSAIRYFERAIELDKDYALAWAGIADCYSLMGEYSNVPRKEIKPKMLHAVNKALEIDNRLAEAHISLATALMLNEWNWKQAEKEYKLGIELNPNYATGHHWYAEYLFYTGQTAEGFREISLATELDPVSHAILKDKAVFYYYNRQYDKSLELAGKSLELEPGFASAHRVLSLAYSGKGMIEEALLENRKWGMRTGNAIKTDIAEAYLLAAAGRKEEALRLTAKIEVSNKFTSNDYRGMAVIFAALDDKDRTFEWLDKSVAMHEESLCSIKIDPKWDSVSSDPRFQTILQRIGLG
jgi:adenylate cyclase